MPNQKARLEEQAKRIRDAVVAHYLETGKPAEAPELAKRLGWSVAKVRRLLDELHGPKGVMAYQETRVSYSRSYPGMEAGAHKVWTYAPALWLLRDIILALEKKE